MINEEILKSAAETVLSCGCGIHVGGFETIKDSDDFISFCRDKYEWLAQRSGVSKEIYLKWLNFRNSGNQCTRTTSKGRQCKNHNWNFLGPEKFVPGESDRCNKHIDIIK
ncbi:MAG: hypothetical protein KGL39_21630 [Patescibacteria group bacterium]|nr:hypothetical protein [Patescibacteria group bacterium]